ncbi:hypothetical protein KM043_006406 [Ampulex compressa]|nr:hypothetical protein KM043_006406 [Ampulex compressa]
MKVRIRGAFGAAWPYVLRYEKIREAGARIFEEKSGDIVVNMGAIPKEERKREGEAVSGAELRHTFSATGVPRYFVVETHRGHISLDLAKQSEHLNFKYGVSVPLHLCTSRSHSPR